MDKCKKSIFFYLYKEHYTIFIEDVKEEVMKMATSNRRLSLYDNSIFYIISSCKEGIL